MPVQGRSPGQQLITWAACAGRAVSRLTCRVSRFSRVTEAGRLPLRCRLSRLRSFMLGKPEAQDWGRLPAATAGLKAALCVLFHAGLTILDPGGLMRLLRTACLPWHPARLTLK